MWDEVERDFEGSRVGVLWRAERKAKGYYRVTSTVSGLGELERSMAGSNSQPAKAFQASRMCTLRTCQHIPDGCTDSVLFGVGRGSTIEVTVWWGDDFGDFGHESSENNLLSFLFSASCISFDFHRDAASSLLCVSGNRPFLV